MKGVVSEMNYNDWQKEFDDRFVVGGSFKVQGNYLEVKDFIKETINALCDELDTLEDIETPKEFGSLDRGQIFKVGQVNILVRLMEKLERIRNEPN